MPSVFITGGAGAIGAATARRFLAEGWRVGIGDLAGALAAAPMGTESFAHDVTDAAAWQDVLGRFAGEGALDVLVNNAGILRWGWFEEQEPAAHAAQVEVNVKGVVLGASIALPFLRRSQTGCLVNIASQASLQAAPRLATYSATKFAVRGLSEALALEWSRIGVRVACLEPGLIDTPMLDSDDAEGGSFRSAVTGATVMTPEDVAASVWKAVTGTELHYPVGEVAAEIVRELAPRLERQRQGWEARLGQE